MIHTVKGFGIVNKAEVDVFLEFSCFFYDPTDIGNLISGSSAFSKSSLNIWKFILLKPDLENFEHHTPLQYSCLENPTDGGAWWAAVHGVAKSQTRLSDFTFTFMHWRRKWQPTPVFLPGESQGWESLVGFHLWGCTESDMIEVT